MQETQEITSLDELIKELNLEVRTITECPCYCGHVTVAKRLLNEFIDEYPDYYMTVRIFCEFSKVKRAQAIRDWLRISEDFYSALNAYSRVTAENIRKQYKRDIKITNEIMNKVEKIIRNKPVFLDEEEEKIFNAVFYDDMIGMKEEKAGAYRTVSKYKIMTKFKDVLLKACEEYDSYFKEKLRRLNKVNSNVCEDVVDIIHDTEMLLRLIPGIEDTMERMKYKGITSADGIDYALFHDTLKRSINATNSPRILWGRVNGETEEALAEMCGKSRTYIRRQYREGVTLLSYVLWGYSIRLFLCGNFEKLR